MNGRQAKFLRKKARRMADREIEQMVPKFKSFVNKDLNLWERIVLAWKIIWKRF
jgi:hypothetical protein